VKAIDLKDIFEQGKDDNIRAYLNFLDHLEIVDLLYILDSDYYTKTVDILDNETISEVLPLLEASVLVELCNSMSPSRLTHIVNLLETDDAAHIIRQLDEEHGHRLLATLDKSQQIGKILSYPKDSAGSIMQTELCLLQEGVLAKDAIEAIRLQKRLLGNVNISYVVDEDRKLIGLVELDDLMISSMSEPISNITNPLKYYVTPEDDQEEVAQVFSKYDLVYVPVVDGMGILLGQITFDDIQDVVEEEASEDILAYVGVSAEESIGDLDQARLKMALGRFPWLIFSICASLVTGFILTFFETHVMNAIIFASFVPLIMNTTGNVGTQTAMIITRSFALGANEFGQFRLPLMREFSVGLLMGLMAGILTFVLIVLIYGNISVAVRVGATLVISMSSAALFGMFIPIGFRKIGIDPAIASGPLVTSFCDLLSVSLFLGIIIAMGAIF
jgi:magnesium transporter